MADPYTQASTAQSRINASPVSETELLATLNRSVVEVEDDQLVGSKTEMNSNPTSPPFDRHEVYLYLMTIAGTFMNYYKNTWWIMAPLHPAALEENNVRYLSFFFLYRFFFAMKPKLSPNPWQVYSMHHRRFRGEKRNLFKYLFCLVSW